METHTIISALYGLLTQADSVGRYSSWTAMLEYLGVHDAREIARSVIREYELANGAHGENGEPGNPAAVNLTWSHPSPPNKECPYDHSIAETPFGRFLLTWKGWKTGRLQDPCFGFDKTPWGEVEYHGFNSVEEAQQWAAQEMARRIQACVGVMLNGTNQV